MPLDRYWQKRDFARTPEPAGAHGASEGPLRFVVQRHRATRLHYDFRLEMGGVLASWAVPRGPSMRPLERRMAAHVEDHPIEYLDFEGVIPRGEYGGGDVIVWDIGTWEPEAETPDPVAAVTAGELKFVLHGERLSGRWVLVRTSGQGTGRRGSRGPGSASRSSGRHTARDEDGDEWLLIHKRDETSDPTWDIDTFPTSVLSGRTNEEIRAGVPAIWDSSKPATEALIDLTAARDEPLPDFVAPMLATPVDAPFSDDDWLFEMKLDGYRVETVVQDGRVRLWTRNRKDAARYFPELAATPPTWIAARTAIVDGEVVALDEDGNARFSLLQDRTGLNGIGLARSDRRRPATTDGDRAGDEDPARPAPLVYQVFDLLHLDGRSLLDVPLEDRKRLLRRVIRDTPRVRYVSHVETDGLDLYAAAEAHGVEGIIAKLRRSTYEPGRRSRAWLKMKIRREQELVVIGFEPGKGSHAKLGSLLVATFEDGAFRYAGEVGSGIDTRTRTALRARLDELATPVPPVIDPPSIKGLHWAEPRIVIRATFAEWTSDGLLRQAAFTGMEPDRDPRRVTRERTLDADRARAAAERAARARAGREKEPTMAKRTTDPKATRPTTSGRKAPMARAPSAKASIDAKPSDRPIGLATPDELAALDRLGAGGPWEVGGHVVTMTNLDKVLWPAPGYTKRDLARYYVTIAPVLLPYLADRPLNTDRWPNGITGHHFWQKQIPSHAPDWVGRWDYPEAGKDQSHTYIVVDRVATLAFLSNQAVIDLHPWTSRLSAYREPTYALVDIDPGERTTWEEVLILARLFRTALGHLGVRGYPKTTGKRGIQVWIPIRPGYTYDDTLRWVESLSRAIAATVPDLVSWDWAKADRGGRARLDYTQNTPIKTLVAPYAARPVATAGVSAPIRWEELDDPTLRPDRWDIRSMPERVAEVGDLFAGALDFDQELPPLG
ncbi:MAG: DNA ligase D [Chloroflexi bacterium]|nr:DNA ligase D [Chloroflexota bacterium]